MQIVKIFLDKHNIKEKNIAIGVSGGADSLALVLKANEELKVYGYNVIALTVDHRLRPTSTTEALYVANIMQKHNIEHHILTWNEEKPNCGIEEAARIARYNLINDWCKKNNVSYLMIAHHLLDQVETFLMRLQRGSGLEGLCSIREVSKWKNLTLLRPLLHTHPDTLKKYLLDKNIKWIEDESNYNEDFLRVRLRNFLPTFTEKTSISANKIDEAITNLQSAENFIETYMLSLFENKIQQISNDIFYLKYTTYLSLHPEIKFRFLAKILSKTYIPRADSLLLLIKKLDKLPFLGMTLGGKEIFLAYEKIWIVPELKSKRKETRKSWKEFIEKNAEYKNKKFPHKVRLAILQNQYSDVKI